MNDGAATRPSDQTAEAWLKRFLEAHSEVNFNALWLTFGLGQAGVLAKVAELDPRMRGAAAAMLDELERHADDFRDSAVHLDAVMRDMLANARRNLEASS